MKRAKQIIFGVAAMVLALSMVTRAQTDKKPAAPAATSAKGSIPDLNGVWLSVKEEGLADFFHIKSWPTHPWAEQEAIYNQGHEEINPSGGEGIGGGDSHGEDQVAWKHCAPLGPSASWQHAASVFEIIQTPEEVIIFHEWDHGIRQIWVDGRPHPKNVKTTWMGHSIGHYENGDTLVIDTVAINPITRMDRVHVNTDAFHLIERIKREGDVITLTITFDDPRALTMPVTGFHHFHLTNFEVDPEITCEDWLRGDTTP